jgi:hypothetical protein
LTDKRQQHPTETQVPVERLSLCDVVLETSALAAAMLSLVQAKELIAAAATELFSISFTRDIYEAIVSLGANCLDYPLLIDELERTGKHFNLGDLGHLEDGVVIEVPMSERLARLQELRRLRELVRIGEELATAPYEIGVKSFNLITSVREQLEAISR